ncbi:hypothetical protein WN55_08828 [Dufourea novaeangliae]|uniref:Uncharacterized protein n=1 Tax=Dufourea novaeangliae TaxID=178035 RepID=A0A154P035_DUFNO|nr:hypothetical protein WN55_08828 [Dufourea novaeangliae]
MYCVSSKRVALGWRRCSGNGAQHRECRVVVRPWKEKDMSKIRPPFLKINNSSFNTLCPFIIGDDVAPTQQYYPFFIMV